MLETRAKQTVKVSHITGAADAISPVARNGKSRFFFILLNTQLQHVFFFSFFIVDIKILFPYFRGVLKILTTLLRIYLFLIFLLWIILLRLFSIRVRTRF
jgi:hypothetical protein